MNLKIKVTKDIIKRSAMCPKETEVYGLPTYHITENCAIALAVRDIFPSARVYGCGTLSFFGHDVLDLTPMNSCLMPYDMRMFVNLFDRLSHTHRLELPEEEFEIYIPDQVIEKINIDDIKPLLKNHPTLQFI